MDYGYWELVKFVNCQSWKEKTIELKPGLNVFEALNETGKSVLVKCLKLGVAYDTPRYTAKKKRSIIRNWHLPNAQPAQFTIMTSKKYLVTFEFHLTHMYTIIITPDKKVKRYKGPAQEDALSILGLIPHGVNNRVMNIIDNEEPMLFDGTDILYNDSVLSNFITHPRLKELYESSLDFQKFYTSKLSETRKQIADLKEQIAPLPRYENLDDVHIMSPELEVLADKLDYMESMWDALQSFEVSQPKPTCSTNELEHLNENNKFQLELYKNLYEIIKYTDRPLIDSNVLEAVIENIKFYKQLGIEFSHLIQQEFLVEIPKEEIVNLEQQLSDINISKNLRNSLIPLLEIETKEELSKDVFNDFNQIISCVDFSLSLKNELINKLVLLNKEEILKNKSNIFEQDMIDLLETIGYCPLCGNKLTDKEHSHQEVI